MMKIVLHFKPLTFKVCFSLALILSVFIEPTSTSANFFGDIITKVLGTDTQASEIALLNATDTIHNSQTLPLLEPSINPDMVSIIDTPENTIFGNDILLVSNNGLMGSGLEDFSSTNEITVYEVKEGDTLSEIADTYNVSQNTIRWENNITGPNIKAGQKLNILPVTGVKHIVKKGDTLAGIALKYDADKEDITTYNDIGTGDKLKQGDILIVPNGISKPSIVVQKAITSSSQKAKKTVSSTNAPDGYYLRPALGPITSPYGSRKGSFHYGVDIGSSRGTQVKAAADGVIISVVNSCVEGNLRCGGRYGNNIVIQHNNGTSTRYAHLSKAEVSIGDNVSQGDEIGKTGNTGGSTGPHLHFQIDKANGSTMRPSF